MAQYMPNHTSLPFLTMLIIHLQAAHPDRKAARKPTISAEVLISAFASDAPFMISIPESNASPKIGGITIRKENCARVSFLLPRISPVAMVLPERESHGITAQAWASPIMKASRLLIFSFCRGLA